MHIIKEQLGKVNQHTMLVMVAVAAVAITAFLVFNPLSKSPVAVANKAADYLNTSILKGGQTATVTSASMENGLVKIKMAIGSNSYDMYATTDGKLLFPEAFNLEGANANATANAGASQKPKTAADLVKADNPMLEAYVVSRCPFGIQMQRAMAKAIAAAPALAQSMKVRYIGDISGNTITAMHGEVEAKENLRQICIREEQSSKYWGYISCHIKEGQTGECERAAGVDSAKVSACTQDASRGVAYAKEDFDLNKKYGITGSPTLILNGQEVSEFDFGGRSPEALKTLVCGGSKTEGAFCSDKLDTQEAATSFSLSYAPSAKTATASAGANCAPIQ